MKKKIISILLICLTVGLLFGSCVETSAESDDTRNRFETVYYYLGEGIYVDTQTKVMYLFVKNGYGGGLTVMVDENGKPLLWEDES